MSGLFDSISLGGLRLKNRFIMAPIKTAYCLPGGKVTERHINFYDNISKGGVSLVILEPVAVTKSGREHPKQICIDNEQCASELSKIVNIIHKNNTFACINLNHAGRAANPQAIGSSPKAPSAMLCPATGATAEELSVEEIEEIVEGFGMATQRAMNLGFDAIEIQCGHGYLINQFLSKRTNKRADKYGQDGLLFAKQVFESVFKYSKNTPVIIRISGSEFVEGGLNPQQNKELLDLAKEYGVSAIHVGFGNACDNPAWYFNHMALPEEPQYQVFRDIRKLTNLPMIVVGRMADKNKLQKIVDENLGDIIAFGRPLIADPQIVNKIEKKDYDSIVYCGYCLQGCLFNVRSGAGVGCIVNPQIDKKPLKKTEKPMKCIVVGAGPAGITAAITLAKKGHTVKLYEKSSLPGGQFRLAPLFTLKESMNRPLNSMIKQLENSNVDTVYNTEVDFELLKSEAPDLVVIATGATSNVPDIEGLNEQYWMTGVDFFSKKKSVKGERVLIIGAGMIGVEAAETLSKEGKTVVATKRTDTIANDMEPITKAMTMKSLSSRDNMKLMPNTTVKRFTSRGVEVVSNGKEVILEPFDTVILTAGMNPNVELYNKIKSQFEHVEIIGDAVEPKNIFAATQAGYEVGSKY